MDPLSDLLRVVGLDGAFFYAVEAAGPWRVESAPAQELTPRVLAAAEHLISYHILTASEVGYDSEAAFSRAFKKATGLAPNGWREVRRTGHALPSTKRRRGNRSAESNSSIAAAESAGQK